MNLDIIAQSFDVIDIVDIHPIIFLIRFDKDEICSA